VSGRLAYSPSTPPRGQPDERQDRERQLDRQRDLADDEDEVGVGPAAMTTIAGITVIARRRNEPDAEEALDDHLPGQRRRR
jgi:hypothetical protein